VSRAVTKISRELALADAKSQSGNREGTSCLHPCNCGMQPAATVARHVSSWPTNVESPAVPVTTDMKKGVDLKRIALEPQDRREAPAEAAQARVEGLAQRYPSALKQGEQGNKLPDTPINELPMIDAS